MNLINLLKRLFRNNKRNPSKGYFSIQRMNEDSPKTVQLLDISNGGAFIQSSTFPDINEIVRFTIILDNFDFSHAGKARVAWCKKTGSKSKQGFGIEFQESLSDELLQKLSFKIK